jgi:adenylosuccinate synthase
LKAFEELECEYITLPGWNTSLKGIRKYDDLPENTKKYLKYIEENSGAKLKIISLSP